MVDTIGFTDAVSGAPAYSGRMLRQTNGVAFAGATSARPLGARSGVRPGTPSTTVTATSTTWTCQPFAGLLDGQTAAEAGPYTFAFDAVATGSVTAANASNPRIDIVYVDVDDPSEDASAVPAATRKYLAGTAAASPSAPATPAGCMAIAQINVPKVGSGSPTVAWVAPYMAAAGGIVNFNTKSELNLWTTATENQRASVLADNSEWIRVGAAWKSLGAPFASASAYANGAGTIASATYAALPTVPVSLSVTAASACKALVTVNCRGSAAAGFFNVGVAVSGATTIAANETASGVTPAGVLSEFANTIIVQVSTSKLVSLNAGTNTFTVQALLGGAGGTKIVYHPYLTVVPVS